jgi:Protein of unknown function (DUF2934)
LPFSAEFTLRVKIPSQKEKAAMKNRSNKKTDSPGSSLTETAAADSALRERIARKSYELYEKRGWVHGHHTEDWLEAERAVMAEIKIETKAKAKTKTVTRPKTSSQEKNPATQSGAVLDRHNLPWFNGHTERGSKSH